MARFEPKRGAWLDRVLTGGEVRGVLMGHTLNVFGKYVGSIPSDTGKVRSSVKFEVTMERDRRGRSDRLAGYVWTEDQVAWFLEYGTRRMPARHLLARAAGVGG